MSADGIKYRRLPGRGRRGWLVIASRCSLWLAPDHILGVQNIGVNEEYKRFYFRDIQSITIEQNRTALMWNCSKGVLATVIGVLFYAFSESAGPGGGAGFLITGGICSGALLLSLIISYLRGPSCICSVRTAVQTEELPSLGRTHAAQKTLAIIKPLIEQAQGAFSASEFANLAAATVPGTPARPVPRAAAAAAPGNTVVIKHPSSGMWHAALFVSLIIDAACGFLAVAHPGWRALQSINLILTIVVMGLCFTALIKQRSAILPESLKKITIAAFCFDIASMFIGVIYGYIYRVNYVIQHVGHEAAGIDFFSMWGFTTLAVIFNTLELLVGVAGLVLAAMHILAVRKAPADAATSPPLA
jgi:hypothetical protein